MHPISWTLILNHRIYSELSNNLLCFYVFSRSEWVHHCKRAARSLSRADFEPLKTVGKGQWGKVFLVRKSSGPVAGRAAADPGLMKTVGSANNVSFQCCHAVHNGCGHYFFVTWMLPVLGYSLFVAQSADEYATR